MRRDRTPSLIALLLALACGHAVAGGPSASFGVGVTVVAPKGTPAAVLPLPSGAAVMGRSGTTTRLAFAGSLAQAQAFYADALPREGFRLVQQAGDGVQVQQQVWQSERERVVLQLQAALGDVAATRISTMSAPLRTRG